MRDFRKTLDLREAKGRRRAISLSQEGLVKTEFLRPGSALPLVIHPAVEGIDLPAWAKTNRDFIDSNLLRYGAVLFRDFKIGTADEFEQLILSVSENTMEYRERSSPRTHVRRNIYTSTDYPASQSIFLHNENSYAYVWPMKIFFFCVQPARSGGETPIADCRKVFQRIDPDIRQRFIEKRVLYVRNFSEGLSLPWETVFQTSDRSQVEQYCRKAGYDPEWVGGNNLRTRRVGQAVVKHPRTEEMSWFNHGTFFHVTTLEPTLASALMTGLNEKDLPNNTYYGDGTTIEPAVLDKLREAYMQEMVTFPWRSGDVLMLDNMLVAHGRAPFEGERKILVGMSEPITSMDIDQEDHTW